MKKFSFSLAKVLDFKHQTLDVLKSEFAVLQMKLREMNEQIENLNLRFSVLNLQMQTEMQEGLPSNDIAVYKTYLNTLNSKTQKLIQMKGQLLEEIAQKEHEILAIKSEISGLEKLKEKQWNEYCQTAQKLQELAIEEFVSHSHSYQKTLGQT